MGRQGSDGYRLAQFQRLPLDPPLFDYGTQGGNLGSQESSPQGTEQTGSSFRMVLPSQCVLAPLRCVRWSLSHFPHKEDASAVPAHSFKPWDRTPMPAIRRPSSPSNLPSFISPKRRQREFPLQFSLLAFLRLCSRI